MDHTLIAVSGKGGSGKTTLTAMMLLEFVRRGVRPVLAVDADPNATLALTLGLTEPESIADLRDRMLQAAQDPTAAPKERLLDQWLAELVGEQAGFDLLTMGRPEGPGCYCYVNALLRRYLRALRGNYAAVIVDCEAGMEYLSRLTVGDVDALVLVAEPTVVGLTSAGRIARVADALPMRVKRRVLAINKVGLPGGGADPPGGADLPPADATVRVPFDEDLFRRCAGGQAIDDSAGGRARQAVAELAGLCLAPRAERAGQPRQKEPIP